MTDYEWQEMMRRTDTPCRPCSLYHHCSFNNIACKSFRHYLSTGEVEDKLERKPTRKIFKGISGEKNIQRKL